MTQTTTISEYAETRIQDEARRTADVIVGVEGELPPLDRQVESHQEFNSRRRLFKQRDRIEAALLAFGKTCVLAAVNELPRTLRY